MLEKREKRAFGGFIFFWLRSELGGGARGNRSEKDWLLVFVSFFICMATLCC